MSSTRPLKIAVLGAGGVGSTFALQLSKVGRHEVTVIARPDSVRLQQLQRDGGIIRDNGERAVAKVADRLNEDVLYDLVIVTLRAHEVSGVLATLQRSSAKHILFMFNNFDPQPLVEAIGAERCSFGMPFVQGVVNNEGQLHAKIGTSQKSILSRQCWVDLFVAAGLPAAREQEMLLWLRCHAPLCVAFESVSAAAMRRGGGASWEESMVLGRGVHECFVLIQKLGYELYPSGKSRLSRSPIWVVAGMLWSMSRLPSFRRLLARGAGESRALVETMAAQAIQYNVAVSLGAIRAMSPIS